MPSEQAGQGFRTHFNAAKIVSLATRGSFNDMPFDIPAKLNASVNNLLMVKATAGYNGGMQA